MKKTIAILLMMLTVFFLGMNAFASGSVEEVTGNGTITISNVTKGKTYKLYKIFDATLDESAERDAYISYTYTGSSWQENSYFSKDEHGYILIQEGAKDTTGHLISEAVAVLAELKGTNPYVQKEASDDTNTLTFNNLAYGYYYVESSLGSAVSVDSTRPTALIIDKNQGPSWTDPEKTGNEDALGKYIIKHGDTAYNPKVTENSVNIGDTVTFEVSFNATNYKGENKVLTYFLTDTIANSFEIIESTIQVYFDGGNPKVQNTDYSLKWNDENHKSFTISAPWINSDNSFKNPANVIFKVTYDAKLLTNAVIASTGNVNTTYYDYRMDSDTPQDTTKPHDPPTGTYHKSEEKTTTTYTYAVGLTKIDGTDKHTLKGAEFSLYKDETAIKATASGTDGVYVLSANGMTQFKPNDNGVLIIKGLEAGTYTLKETKAPDGYNRESEGKTFTLQELANSSPKTAINYSSTHTVYFNKDGKETETEAVGGKKVTTDYGVNVLGIVFENNRGTVLPITGGTGTTVFYVVGGALVFVALLLLITKNRMRNGK